MTRIAHLIISTLSLVAWAAADASPRCAWAEESSDRKVHLTFLRRAPGPGAPPLRLYHSVRSRERAPLGCAWSDDAALVGRYVALCRERARPSPELDVDALLEECASVGDAHPSAAGQGRSAGSEVKEAPRRVKRGFIVPGTLWCGSGNKAPSYEDLGVFSDTDSCCREHDQCKNTILSFQSRFGVFNSNIFTMSHCDCDNKFHSCLRRANDSISDVVGYTFFNLLKMHCFEFSHRLQCTQRNWFGMCKETKMALYAEVHPPTLYESSGPSDVSINGSVLRSAGRPEVPPQLSLDAAALSGTGPPVSSTAGPVGPGASTSAGVDAVATQSTGTRNLTEQDADVADERLACSVFKDLDDCRDRIPPQQTRFGLRNPKPQTVYHCNCTSRFFQTLSERRRPTDAQMALLGHVSPSCLLLQGCSTGTNCSSPAVQPIADFHQPEQDEGAEVRRRLRAEQRRIHKRKPWRAKRKDRTVQLQKMCLRMVLSGAPKAGKMRQNVGRTTARAGKLIRAATFPRFTP